MSLESWLLYASTVLALTSTPGLSHLLMLSNSMVNGFRPSLLTACGGLTTNILQMPATGSGHGATLGWLGAGLKGQVRVWLDRDGGGLIIGAAVLLGLKPIGCS